MAKLFGKFEHVKLRDIFRKFCRHGSSLINFTIFVALPMGLIGRVVDGGSFLINNQLHALSRSVRAKELDRTPGAIYRARHAARLYLSSDPRFSYSVVRVSGRTVHEVTAFLGPSL